MRDRENRDGPIGSRTVAVFITALALVITLLAWAPWNPQQVASNPELSGTPGSTVVERAPPPADSPSNHRGSGALTAALHRPEAGRPADKGLSPLTPFVPLVRKFIACS